jgi:hypothetical protein
MSANSDSSRRQDAIKMLEEWAKAEATARSYEKPWYDERGKQQRDVTRREADDLLEEILTLMGVDEPASSLAITGKQDPIELSDELKAQIRETWSEAAKIAEMGCAGMSLCGGSGPIPRESVQEIVNFAFRLLAKSFYDRARAARGGGASLVCDHDEADPSLCCGGSPAGEPLQNVRDWATRYPERSGDPGRRNEDFKRGDPGHPDNEMGM